MTGDDDSKAVMPVKGSVRNTDEIAIDDDEDEMEEVGAPSRKQQMARMNIQEKAIPAAVPLHPSTYLALFRYPSLLSLTLFFLITSLRGSEVSFWLCDNRYTEGWLRKGRSRKEPWPVLEVKNKLVKSGGGGGRASVSMNGAFTGLARQDEGGG